MKRAFYTFLGVKRFQNLWNSWNIAGEHQLQTVSAPRVLVAILISLLPAIATALQPRMAGVDFVSILVGIGAVSALLLRRGMGISFEPVKNWAKNLSLTHTAFALGCLPIAIILLGFPEALDAVISLRQETVRSSASTSTAISKPLFIASVAIWAGLTEELIYRGLLLSTLRRWSLLSGLKFRDHMAVVVSAALFAGVHLPLWGPTMSIAVFGLGIGLGIGYVVAGELLLPLIIYHILFDAVALTVAYGW